MDGVWILHGMEPRAVTMPEAIAPVQVDDEKARHDEVDRRTVVAGVHGWIQWKGTNVCIDIYCECGHHSHLDEEFAYFVRCPKCHQVYAMGAYIKLVPLAGAPKNACGVKDAW